jgi:hypothetical protein
MSLINVLYVNNQEFSASSWRSIQGYTKMHGQPPIKIWERYVVNWIGSEQCTIAGCGCAWNKYRTVRNAVMKEGFQTLVLFNSTFCHSLSLYGCVCFINNFGQIWSASWTCCADSKGQSLLICLHGRSFQNSWYLCSRTVRNIVINSLLN